MIKEIRNFLSTMDKTVKKESVLQIIPNVMNGISNDVIPGVASVIDNAELKIIKNNNLLKLINSESGFKNNKSILVSILNMFKSFLANERLLTEIVKKDMSDVIMIKLAKSRDVMILKTISDIGSVSQYVLDLMYLIVLDKETDYPKIMVDGIRKNLLSFTSALDIYGKGFDKTLLRIKSSPNVTVGLDDKNDSYLNTLLFKSDRSVLDANTSGFKNNPFYHIRMWFVDRDAVKHENLKHKKKLLEFKMLELQMKKRGESDPSIDKQIKYYEEKISSVQYKITKLEEI